VAQPRLEEPDVLTAEEEAALVDQLVQLAGIRLSAEEAYQADRHDQAAQDQESGKDTAPKEPAIQGRGGKVDMTRLLCDLLGALGITIEHTSDEAQFKQNIYSAALQALRERTGQGQQGQQPTPDKGTVNPLIKAVAPNHTEEHTPVYMGIEQVPQLTPEEEAALVDQLSALMGAVPEGAAGRDEDDRLADLLIKESR
jgi:hypothetical protein